MTEPMTPPHRPGFRVEEWEDETSMYDPQGYYCPGSDCYYRRCRCYVPIRLKPENLYDWLDRNEGKVVWIDNNGNPLEPSNAE